MNGRYAKDDLSSLKPGDEVVITGNRMRSDELATIDRITPSGMFIVGKSTYNPDGRRRGEDSFWGRSRITIPTPEKRAIVVAATLRGRIRAAVDSPKMIEWSLDKLERVWNAIRED